MRFTTVILAPLLGATAVYAATIRICHGYDFKECKDIAARSGHCTAVPKDYNDRIASAKVIRGRFCSSYKHISCDLDTMFVPYIDKDGERALYHGEQTSGFICYD